MAGFLQIVVIDLALSADNAIVIGVAAASLPHEMRIRAILIGGACAIGLRIGLTAIVTTLIQITLISALAGAVLFWVAWKLLKMDVGSQDPKGKPKVKTANNFRQAIILILVADFTMSLDNILAIAGTAKGSYLLLIIGLLISMPLLMTTGGFISRLVDKFKWIPFIGAAIITFTGMRMILEDKFIEPRLANLAVPSTWILIISALVGILFTSLIFWLNKRRVAIKTTREAKPH